MKFSVMIDSMIKASPDFEMIAEMLAEEKAKMEKGKKIEYIEFKWIVNV